MQHWFVFCLVVAAVPDHCQCRLRTQLSRLLRCSCFARHPHAGVRGFVRRARLRAQLGGLTWVIRFAPLHPAMVAGVSVSFGCGMTNSSRISVCSCIRMSGRQGRTNFRFAADRCGVEFSCAEACEEKFGRVYILLVVLLSLAL